MTKKNNLICILLNYFYRVGILSHVLAGITLVVISIISLYIYQSYNLPAKVFFQRASITLANDSSPLLRKLAKPAQYLAEVVDSDTLAQSTFVSYNTEIVGAHIKRSSHQYVPLDQEHNGTLQPFYQVLTAAELPTKQIKKVFTTKQLLLALNAAKPGDDIVIAAGDYQIPHQQIYLSTHGTQTRPIRLRAERFGEVRLLLDTLEGLVMMGDYWIVENLKIVGICAVDQQCEHAIHIVGAKNLIIRNNEMINFNSTVKANAKGRVGHWRYPDNILFEYNSIYNQTSRQTNSSVTLLDVVTGSNWIVRKNFIANNSKHGSDYVSYALFLKGNGENGIIEENIIDCEWSLPNDNHTRVGISLGGGGTGQQYCRGGACSAEHHNGIIRNNLVANCSQDVGIYLNKASNTQIIHNTLLNTTGVDVRFHKSSAEITNNLITGKIRTRNGGSMTLSDNTTKVDIELEAALPLVLSKAESDLCGFERFKFSSAGAIGSECAEKLNLTRAVSIIK